jgi:hypothetical protein
MADGNLPANPMAALDLSTKFSIDLLTISQHQTMMQP